MMALFEQPVPKHYGAAGVARPLTPGRHDALTHTAQFAGLIDALRRLGVVMAKQPAEPVPGSDRLHAYTGGSGWPVVSRAR